MAAGRQGRNLGPVPALARAQARGSTQDSPLSNRGARAWKGCVGYSRVCCPAWPGARASIAPLGRHRRYDGCPRSSMWVRAALRNKGGEERSTPACMRCRWSASPTGLRMRSGTMASVEGLVHAAVNRTRGPRFLSVSMLSHEAHKRESHGTLYPACRADWWAAYERLSKKTWSKP